MSVCIHTYVLPACARRFYNSSPQFLLGFSLLAGNPLKVTHFCSRASLAKEDDPAHLCDILVILVRFDENGEVIKGLEFDKVHLNRLFSFEILGTECKLLLSWLIRCFRESDRLWFYYCYYCCCYCYCYFCYCCCYYWLSLLLYKGTTHGSGKNKPDIL